MARYGVAPFVILDRPDCMGVPLQWGWGYTWDAAQAQATRGAGTPIEEQVRWETADCEYLPALRAWAPKAIAMHSSMNLGDWENYGGYQYAPVTRRTLGRQWLEKGATPATGTIELSEPLLWGAAQMRVFRLPSAEGEGGEGDGARSWVALGMHAGNVWLRVICPADGFEDESPVLQGTVGSSGDWIDIARWEGGPTFRGAGSGNDGFYWLRWEQAHGGSLITAGPERQQWHVAERWRDHQGNWHGSGITARESRLLFTANNLPVCVHAEQLHIRAAGTVLAAPWLQLGSIMAQADCQLSGKSTLHPSDAVPEEAMEAGVAWQQAGSMRVPACAFSAAELWPGTGHTAVRRGVRSITGWAPAVIGDAASDPVASIGNPHLRLVEASGTLREDHRGATASLVVEGEWDADTNARLPVEGLWPSTWVRVGLQWGGCPEEEEGQEGEGNGGGEPEPEPDPEPELAHVLFTGFGEAVEVTSARDGTRRYEIAAEDQWELRMNRSLANMHPTYDGGRPVPAYQYLFNRAGVAVGFCTHWGGDWTERRLPGGDREEAALAFAPDATLGEVADAFDAALGTRSGVLVDGRMAVWPVPHPEPGSYIGTIAQEPSEDGGIVTDVAVSRALGEFTNLLTVIAGAWPHRSAQVADLDSIYDPGSGVFVGAIREQVVLAPRVDDAAELARTAWRDARRDVLTARITLYGYRPLAVGQRYLIDLPGTNLPPGSIMRLRQIDWRVTRDRRFIQDCEFCWEDLARDGGNGGDEGDGDGGEGGGGDE